MKSQARAVRKLTILGCLSLVLLAGCEGGKAQIVGGSNPGPTIVTISPTSSVVGSAAFTLTVNGTNFISSSVVEFSGTAVATTFVGPQVLTAAIPATAIATAGSATVVVFNPAPGGGTSNAMSFAINTATPPNLPGPSSGPFTMIASMNTARANQTATLLPNGKVLIAGGVGLGFQPLASAELYDPSTGTFTPTGSMNAPRGHAAAVLLASGKVLITGGSQDLSAELYDPSTGIFATTGNMISGGISNLAAPAVMLQDGRVLVEAADAEIYDPAINTFAATVAYPDANPLWFTATLLLDGRVLSTGCVGTPACTAGATELFDPKAATFNTTGALKQWGNENTATLLMNGKVLIVGSGEDELPADAELYDPASGTFASLGTATAPHEFAAAVRLQNGTVLITGGQLAGGGGSVGTDLYDPATGNFTSGGKMTTGRQEHTATLLPDGTVLIAGGYNIWPSPTSNAEIYKPAQ